MESIEYNKNKSFTKILFVKRMICGVNEGILKCIKTLQNMRIYVKAFLETGYFLRPSSKTTTIGT